MKTPMFALMAVLALAVVAAPQRERSAKETAARPGIIAPAAAGELRLRATFVSCSVCFGASAPVAGLSLECRAAGGEWKAQPPPSSMAPPIGPMSRCPMNSKGTKLLYTSLIRAMGR